MNWHIYDEEKSLKGIKSIFWSPENSVIWTAVCKLDKHNKIIILYTKYG